MIYIVMRHRRMNFEERQRDTVVQSVPLVEEALLEMRQPLVSWALHRDSRARKRSNRKEIHRRAEAEVADRHVEEKTSNEEEASRSDSA